MEKLGPGWGGTSIKSITVCKAVDEGTVATTVNGKKENTSLDPPRYLDMIARICPSLVTEGALSTKKRTVYSEGPVKGESYSNC